MPKTDNSTASYVLLKHQLQSYGCTVHEYDVGSEHYVEYTHPNGKVWLTRTGHFSYPLNHGAVMEMADNKSLAHGWMEQFEVAQASTITLGYDEELSNDKAYEWLKRFKRLVVKPESSFASHGLTTNVTSLEELQEAIRTARATEHLSNNIIVQEYIDAEEIRLTLLHGRVISILQRQMSYLIGDGIQTISELLAAENQARQQTNVTSMVSYPALDATTLNIDKDMDYVLDSGEKIRIAESTMISGGASVFEIKEKVHRSYIDFVEDIINRLGAAFIVVDLFTKDFTKPMTKSNAYFNEFNKAPALKMYYSTRDGKDFDIVPVLSKAIFHRLEQM